MRQSGKLSTFQSEYDKLVSKLRFRHPSYFDEYKTYQQDMFEDDSRTENDLWRDFLTMAFKIEVRQNPKYAYLSYDEIDEIAKSVVDFC